MQYGGTIYLATKQALDEHWRNLDGQQPKHLYQLCLEEMERALFEHTLEHAKNNQSKAATLLGISRTTLKKRILNQSIENTT